MAKLLASLVATLVLAGPALGEDAKDAGPPRPPPSKARHSPYRALKQTSRARLYYMSAWGVDRLTVKSTASGNLIRFSYRVTDPDLAKALVDKGATPYLYGPRTRALLHIPVMEKVGPLRQTGAVKSGQEYWMTFSNKGNLVKPGDRVNVLIGAFRAEGLLVEGS